MRVQTELGRRGSKWIFTPKACPWRNGQLERCIGLAKTTLARLLKEYSDIDYHQLKGVFARTASILNERPLAVRTS